MRRIQRTREMSMTILPRAGIDRSTVDTMICRFFKNLHKTKNQQSLIHIIALIPGVVLIKRQPSKE